MEKKTSFGLLLQLGDPEKNVLPPFPYLLFLNTFSQVKIPTLFLRNLYFFSHGLIPPSAVYDLYWCHGIKYLP